MASVDVERVRRLIDGLRRDRRVHPHHGRREYSRLGREVAAECDALIATEPTAVPPLTRRGVERITAAMMYLDDSSGAIGDDLAVMMDVHARACAAALPDPKRLAAWLAKLRLDGPGWPDFELRDFAPALGEQGRAELARIVAERAPSAERDFRGREPFGIRTLREQLAEISGDVDHFVAMLAQDLYAAPQYLKIVAALRAAGRRTEAEEWAYKGLTGLGNPIQLDELRNAYVDLLLERGANEMALAVRYELFNKQPTQSHYVDLRRTAERTGDWISVREHAIKRLHDAAASRPAFADQLIGVLLDERQLDHAWMAAHRYAEDVPDSRWRQLIDLRQPDHPADVIEPLKQLIAHRLDLSTDKYRYNRAITMLRQLRDAYRAIGDESGLRTYLDELRRLHGRKTSFIAKLDRANL